MIIDVTDPPSPYTGIDSTGSSDIHDALQDMIDGKVGATPGPRGVLYFPAGLYRLESTLNFVNATGYHLLGSGMAQKPENPGARAAIFWSGSAGGTMIDYGGTGLIWNGLTLWGRSAGGGNRADIGIRINKPSGGSLNTGRIWFPSIMVDDCATGIKAEGAQSAGSCAFGYLWARGCDTAVRLDGTGATMFNFRFVQPLSTNTIFQVTGGGRLYVAFITAVSGTVLNPTTLLDLQGGDINNGFYQINGMVIDGGVTDITILKNHDDGDGLQFVRFTNAMFTNAGSNQVAKIDIDRSQSTSGQTVVEFVGGRQLALGGGALTGNVIIKGVSSSKKSRLIIRDSEIAAFPGDPPKSQLINETDSSNYTEDRIQNWVFNAGLVDDEFQAG